jgi:hypothetical protein
MPLFVEELTRLLLESGEHGGIQAIPPTLQQSLTAQLDRLGSAREVAQIGAVIGRDFSYPLVRAVTAVEDAPLQAALERLAEADILLVQGVPPDSNYRFKHAHRRHRGRASPSRSRYRALRPRRASCTGDPFWPGRPDGTVVFSVDSLVPGTDCQIEFQLIHIIAFVSTLAIISASARIPAARSHQ